MATLEDIFEQNAGTSMEKQLALADLIGELDWSVDMGTGKIAFGDQYEMPLQLLGTEGEGAGTWLWAWANAESNLPAALLRDVNKLRDYGAKQGVIQLIRPESSLVEVSGHLLAMIAAGVCDASGYYRCPYQGGALFVLVDDPQLSLPQPPNLPRMTTTFTQLISAFEFNHRKAFEAYASQRGLTVKSSGANVMASGASGAITAQFDSKNRLTNLALTAGGK